MLKKSELKRQAILDATLCEFEANGFAAARIEDIAKRAGVAKGTVYNYFESKEALLMGLAGEFGDLMQAALEDAARDTSGTVREHLEKVSHQLLAENGNGRLSRVLRVVWSEGLHRPELTRPIFEKFLLPKFAPEGVMTQLVRDENVPEVMRKYPFLLAAPILQGIMWQTLIGQAAPLDLQDVYKGYLDFVFAGQKGK
ncbi:MAG: TetR/AcrR family transcriptional regulator [Sutterellaceae bacterium]|nr:TetR/AcrR family transcriptional regulator [Sutterellaceae bacterium]